MNACFRDEGERKLSFFLLAGKKGPTSTETTPPPPLPFDCPSFLGKEGKYRAGRGDWPAAGGSLSKREAAKKRASRPHVAVAGKTGRKSEEEAV